MCVNFGILNMRFMRESVVGSLFFFLTKFSHYFLVLNNSGTKCALMVLNYACYTRESVGASLILCD